MKFSNAALITSFVSAVACYPLQTRDVDPSLVPSLGWVAGLDPVGNGNCIGAVDDANGQPVQVPCDCPPSESVFLQALNANVAAGHAVNNPPVAVSFPTSNSTADQITRIQAALVTLQNLNGVGVGCPAASTTLSLQLTALQDGTTFVPPTIPTSSSSFSFAPTSTASIVTSSSVAAQCTPSTVTVTVTASVATSTPNAVKIAVPAPSSSSAAASTGSSSSTGTSSQTFDGSTLAQIDALTPQFGHDADVNPDGTGNCDGAVNGSNGKPILVPCACPPPRDQFILSLAEDIAAGHAVNNTVVNVSFPTDNSPQSQRTRIQAALVALQNLHGAGVGCPASSTTFSAQLAAIQG